MSLIDIQNMTKVYKMGEVEVHALRGVSVGIERGEWIAIVGPSGSGKSTLMHLISCLDTPTSGQYLLDGVDVSQMRENELAAIRNNLLARTSALKQVMLPLQYSRNGTRIEPSERKRRALAALDLVGLSDRVNHKPSELSGGQQQRVAIARALVIDPTILMADEPTGNLDSESGGELMEIFHRLHSERGITLVMVTHDEEISAQAERIIRLKDGKIMSVEA